MRNSDQAGAASQRIASWILLFKANGCFVWRELKVRTRLVSFLTGQHDELDDAERSCAWEDDENRSRLGMAYKEQEAADAACAERERRFATSDTEGR